MQVEKRETRSRIRTYSWAVTFAYPDTMTVGEIQDLGLPLGTLNYTLTATPAIGIKYEIDDALWECTDIIATGKARDSRKRHRLPHCTLTLKEIPQW